MKNFAEFICIWTGDRSQNLFDLLLGYFTRIYDSIWKWRISAPPPNISNWEYVIKSMLLRFLSENDPAEFRVISIGVTRLGRKKLSNLNFIHFDNSSPKWTIFKIFCQIWPFLLFYSEFFNQIWRAFTWHSYWVYFQKKVHKKRFGSNRSLICFLKERSDPKNSQYLCCTPCTSLHFWGRCKEAGSVSNLIDGKCN